MALRLRMIDFSRGGGLSAPRWGFDECFLCVRCVLCVLPLAHRRMDKNMYSICFMGVPPTADSTACPTVGGLCYCVWLSCHAFLIVLCIELGLLSVSVRASLFICCCISCSKVVCWFLAYLVGFARLSVDFVEGIKRGRPTCFLLQVGRPAFCYSVWRFRF